MTDWENRGQDQHGASRRRGHHTPNEFLKEHRKVEDQQTTIAQLKAQLSREEKTNAQQTKAIKNLTAALKEQANAIQKVSARLELMKPAGKS